MAKWSGEGDEDLKKREMKWDVLITDYNLQRVTNMENLFVKFATMFLVLF